jgi:hypothetical protein
MIIYHFYLLESKRINDSEVKNMECDKKNMIS